MTIDELMNYPISDTESRTTSPLSYEHSYSNASSEEEFNKLQENRQIEPEKKRSNNIHKYDATIRISSEDLENSKEVYVIYGKINNGEKLTESDLITLKNYNQRQELAMKRLKETIQTMQEKLKPLIELQPNYDKLNEVGREEASKRIGELTEIPRYTKPGKPPQD